MTEWIIHRGVCRTAPATPGVLSIADSQRGINKIEDIKAIENSQDIDDIEDDRDINDDVEDIQEIRDIENNEDIMVIEDSANLKTLYCLAGPAETLYDAAHGRVEGSHGGCSPGGG